jgi:hypothetical protein
VTLKEINQFFSDAQDNYKQIEEKIARAKKILIKEKTLKWDLERSQVVEQEKK